MKLDVIEDVKGTMTVSSDALDLVPLTGFGKICLEVCRRSLKIKIIEVISLYN